MEAQITALGERQQRKVMGDSQDVEGWSLATIVTYNYLPFHSRIFPEAPRHFGILLHKPHGAPQGELWFRFGQ